MKLTAYAALAATFVMTTGLGKKPTTDRPQIGAEAMQEEAQRQLAYVYESRLKDQARVLAVADRLLLANTDLCPATKRFAGVSTVVVGDVAAKEQPAVAQLLGTGTGPLVTYVSAGGPAAEAGLAKGDEILTLDGAAVKTGKGGGAAFSQALNKALLSPAETIALTYRRGGEEHEAVLRPKLRCGYAAGISDDAVVNAYADGQSIFVTRPMLRVATTEDELALVLAHELAHNTEGHSKSKKTNAALGMLGGGALDILIAAAAGVDTQGAFSKAGAKLGAEAYSVGFEQEADYVGLYFMTRAGFKTEGVEEFWRRMAVENPGAILAKSSHPPTAERYLAIRATRDEIASRSGLAEALTPQRRTQTTAKASTTAQTSSALQKP